MPGLADRIPTVERERRPGGSSAAWRWSAVLGTGACGIALASVLHDQGLMGLAWTVGAVPLLLLGRRAWVPRAIVGLLLASLWAWWKLPMEGGLRGTGLVLSVAAAGLLASGPVRRHYRQAADTACLSSAVFLLVASGLALVRWKAPLTMLLADRFWPGWGPLEIGGLACYGAWLSERMWPVRQAPVWRGRLWKLFSAVFFLQLILGLSGFDIFLQTGRLHLPIPALIIGGPVYRGAGLFMMGLFACTILLVGPAWCSHLCYVGAWDHTAAHAQRRGQSLPGWRRWGRVFTLVLVAGVALLLRSLGAASGLAIGLASAFGLAGVACMVLWSRRSGVMTHCTAFCPMGLVATRLGRINPFRIRIAPDCTDCMACTHACRFDALGPEQVRARQPGPACTLCADCLPACRHGHLAFELLGRRGDGVRRVYLALVVSLHAMFLGLARI